MGSPDLLYHYCSNNTFCSIVNGKSIWLSSLSLSNDSMEGKWIRGLFEAECQSAGIKDRDLKAVLRNFDLLLGFADGLGFCLSEADDMLSQWRGYASNGEGVSIGFRREYLATGQEPIGNASGFRLRKVNYGELEEKETLSNVVQSLKKASEDGLITPPGLLSAPTTAEGWTEWRRKSAAASFHTIFLIGDLFTVKNPAFREELEWRLLSLDFRQMEMDTLFRASGSSIVPYRSYQLDLSRNPISRVVLGPRNQSNEKDIHRFLKKCGYTDVEVSRSSASYR